MVKIKQDKIYLTNVGRLTKLTDDKYEGEHPNGVLEGNVYTGFIVQRPLVGQSCVLNNFHTSVITEILEVDRTNITFKTLNSTYLFEIIDFYKETQLL